MSTGVVGCFSTYEPVPASRHLTTRTDTIRALSSHHPPTTRTHTYTHISSAESVCVHGCVGVCVCGEGLCGEMRSLGKKMAEGEGGGGEGRRPKQEKGTEGTQTEDTQMHHKEAELEMQAPKRRAGMEGTEAFPLSLVSSVKDCEDRHGERVRMPCGHQLLPLTIVPLPLLSE